MNGAQVKDAIVYAIENRTISHKDDAKVAEYEAGRYNPKFAFVVRESELKCVWVGNLQKESKGNSAELPIVEVGNSTLREGMTPKGWDGLVDWIHPHMQGLTELL